MEREREKVIHELLFASISPNNFKLLISQNVTGVCGLTLEKSSQRTDVELHNANNVNAHAHGAEFCTPANTRQGESK